MNDMHTVTLNLEVYVHEREMPLMWPLRLDVAETVKSVNQIMSHAYGEIENILADNREINLVLVDERYSRHVVPKTSIQAFSIQAPDASVITWRVEE